MAFLGINMNDEQLLNSFYNSIFKEKETIFNLINKQNMEIPPQFNIAQILDYSNLEIYNSKLIYEMLRLNFIAEGKEINFAKDFADYIIKKRCLHTEINTDNKIDVYKEVPTSDNRRIDILIKSEDNFEIILENKINSYELNNQLYDYYKDRSSHINENKLFVVFLTKFGYDPNSLGDKYNKLSEDNRICRLSHDELGDFIEENIIKKYPFLQKNVKYHSLYSGLIQMRDNEKIITNQFRNEDMEDKVIKDYLDKTKEYQELNNVDDIDNYLNLLYKVSNIIRYRKVEIKPLKDNIEFIDKVIPKLNEYFSDKKHTNSILSIDNIKYQLVYKNFSQAITLNLKDVHLQLSVILWINKDNFYISIYSNDEIIRNKLYKPSIKENIRDIMKFDQENDEEKQYVYGKYIQVGIDDVSNIASVMIKLYEYLLKENL